jgi:phage repressor protein C with HTH and peptisase S24 domain
VWFPCLFTCVLVYRTLSVISILFPSFSIKHDKILHFATPSYTFNVYPPRMDNESQQLRLIRERYGLSQHAMAEKLGVTRNWVLSRELGEVRIKSADWLLVAEKLSLPPELLPKQVGNAAMIQLRFSGRIPVVGLIPAGWSKVVYHDGDMDYVSRHAEQGDRLFACVVHGDSMQPALREGDVVIFNDLQEGDEKLLVDGKVVAVSWTTGEVCVARMQRVDDKRIRLVKDNPKYGERIVTLKADEIVRIGVLVSHRKGWA